MREAGQHTSYLSILVHRHIIQASKKYTKKDMNSRRDGQNWSKWAKIGKKFAFSMLKIAPVKKSTQPPLVAVVTNVTYAGQCSFLYSVTRYPALSTSTYRPSPPSSAEQLGQQQYKSNSPFLLKLNLPQPQTCGPTAPNFGWSVGVESVEDELAKRRRPRILQLKVFQKISH